MDKIVTLQNGGLSGIHFTATLDPNNTQGIKQAFLEGREVKDITDIHPKEEIFLLGNLYALKSLASHLCRGAFGVVAGLCTLGGAWFLSGKVREMTSDLAKIPADLLKSVPLFGNLFAAHCNKAAFNLAATKEAAAAAAKEAAAKEARVQKERAPKELFHSAKSQLDADFFYKGLAEKSKLGTFLSDDGLFPELRKLTFEYRNSKKDSDMQNLKAVISKMQTVELYYFLEYELPILEKALPSDVWQVFQKVFTEKTAKAFNAAANDIDRIHILQGYFSRLPLETLFKLRNFILDDITMEYPLTDEVSIEGNMWKQAIRQHLDTLTDIPTKQEAALQSFRDLIK